MKQLTIIALVVVLGGCFEPSGPLPPSSAEPLVPIPAEYEGWWSIVERCAGARAPLAGVRFLRVETPTIPGTHSATAAWYSRSNEIVLAAGRERDGAVVRHEMLHAVLRSVTHEREYFLDRCNGIVSCSDHCVREAGGLPSRSGNDPVVSHEELHVSVEAAPLTISLSDRTGCATIVVGARNPRPDPVWASLGDGPPPFATFGWELEGVAVDSLRTTSPRVHFAKGETQHHVFECALSSALFTADQAPGDYLLRGTYRGRRTEPVRIVLVQ